MASSSPSTRPVPSAVLERLKAVVGPGGFIDTPSDTAAYVKPWRGTWEGRTPLVLRPAATEEVAKIVKICAETRTPIVPQGGNTGMTYGALPAADMSEVVVSTSRMRRIRGIDPVNDTMTVDAGVVLRDIQTAAADAGRLFPLSLGAEGSCQIGGNISTNAGGIQVLRYGNTRNLILGLEVVLPDGRVWNGLRGLRKDNTGYDMKQLFIGAEGTLGIVTAAVLRLFPKPTEAQSAWIAVDSPAAGLDLLMHMKNAMGEAITSFELIRRSIIDFLLAGVPGHSDPMPEPHPWYVLMEVTGQGAAGSLSDPLAAALEGAIEKGLVRDAVFASSSEQSKRLWRMREDLPDAQKAAGGSIAHDVSVPLSRLAEFIEKADTAIGKAYPEARHCCFGHLGDGNLHYNPICPVGWSYERFSKETASINRIVHDIVASLGGSISAEHGIGRLRFEENLHYKSGIEMSLMAAMKRALDPLGIMNPGRVVSL
jgi:FAD/FMN-containing dehydrogenase